MTTWVKNMYGTQINYDGAVVLMDDDLREELCYELVPCTEQEFFTAYEKAHLEKYGKIWELSEPCPQY